MRAAPFLLAAAVIAGASNPAAAHDFSYNEVFLGYLKLAPPANIDEATDQYMNATQRRTWQSAKENELTFPQAAAKAKENLKWQVGKFNIGEGFEIVSDASLGAYDQKTQSFEFDGLTSGTFFSPEHDFGAPDLKVSFINTFPLSRIRVPLDLAAKFLAKNGNYRPVTLHIQFVMVKAYPGTGSIKAKITSLTVKSQSGAPMTLATVRP